MDSNFSALLLENLPFGVMLSDDDTRAITWVNDALCELLVAGRDDLVGAEAEALLGALRKDVVSLDTDRYHVRTSTGDRRWVQCRRTAIQGPDGTRLTLRCCTDVTEFQTRAKARSAVMVGLDVSRLDVDSGVLDRRALLTELGSQVSRSRRYENPLSALLVRYSDCGRLLEGTVEVPENRRLVAEQVKEILRWVDVVGALGTGEFLIVLPETAADSAAQVQAKIVAALTSLGDRNCPITNVVSRTTWSSGDTAANLLERLKTEAERIALGAGSESAA